jgi:hypothetical protein
MGSATTFEQKSCNARGCNTNDNLALGAKAVAEGIVDIWPLAVYICVCAYMCVCVCVYVCVYVYVYIYIYMYMHTSYIFAYIIQIFG